MARKKDKAEKMADEVRYWLSEIGAAKKREKEYRDDGKEVRSIYAGEKAETTPFNILFSNTEVMLPALYSAIPRPVVQRRYKDADPIGRAAASAAQKYLEFQLDTNLEGYETFDDCMRAASLDALLPGRGVTSVKYDADVQEVDGQSVKMSDNICTSSTSWDRWGHGYARKWSEVPWMYFEKYVDRKEAIRLFGEEMALKIEYTKGEEGDDDDQKKDTDDREMGERRTALVYQIWDRAGGKVVRYVSPQYLDGYLKVEDDPLGLSGFFNVPKPLKFIEKTDDLVPTSLYSLYENQAKEMNSLTVRINKIVRAIKARGVYDSALGSDIGNLMEADDNELIPTEKGASLAAEGGFDKAIWFMPLGVLVSTLRELYAAREQTKQTIYEIIGIADILRGASNAAETLGAQQIKTQWGTLRLKPKQAEVQRYARDLLRMMVEIAAKQFSEDSWARMTGLPFLTQQQAQQAQQMVQMGQMMATQAQMSGQQPDPALMQQVQQAQQQLQQPTWQAVLGTLKDDLQRAFKIDIETNSTIQPEAAEDQKNIADLLGALGQYLQQVGPMVIQGILPFETAKSMMLAITRRFRFGSEIEDQIQGMQPPQAKQPEGDGGAQKLLAMQSENAQLKGQLQGAQQQVQAVQKSAELDKRESDLALREHAHRTDREVFRLEQQRAAEALANKAQTETQKLEHKRQLTGLQAKQEGDKVRVQADSQKAASAGIDKLAQAISAQTEQIKALVEIAPKRKKKAA